MTQEIFDVDADADRVAELMEEETVQVRGSPQPLSEIVGDIEAANSELDAYKSGAVSLSQTLSEAAENADDETLETILTEMSDGAFITYLRLHRGDKEMYGERDGKYSGYLTE
jgi:hypothetical protein